MKIRDRIKAELDYQASVEGETADIGMCRVILDSVNNTIVFYSMTTMKPATSSVSNQDSERHFHYVKPWVGPFIEKMYAAKNK